MRVLKLIEELEDIIENGSSIPFANKVMVDRNDALEIIKEIRIHLPDEIKQAQWIKEERQKILIEAQQEADLILEEANKHIREMVEEDEITKKAQKQAEDIVKQAQSSAKEMRIGAREYVDQLLGLTEEKLLEVIGTIKENRSEIKEMK
ncbi:ATP synthase F0 subunit B [Alkaliphilus pronyensis]|uniref:ATP synthase F0 subunit B n=1 Tax=Alkaliphilus pronyensis TaxID=1482732 RepID=A0A6I0EZ34_9FIRM|nr:ATPase [Alkaliphilus pronyensis]KAB3535218.1 ATP synthase F0 subunit B [Alkaliphilus pronyensis]